VLPGSGNQPQPLLVAQSRGALAARAWAGLRILSEVWSGSVGVRWISGAVALVASLAVATVAGVSAARPGVTVASCSVAGLPASALARGRAEVVGYRRLRRTEFGPDLMGYRRGPRLGLPTRSERRYIAEVADRRRFFQLNTNRLLIRRLEHAPAAYQGFEFPLTDVEVRETLDFQNSLTRALGVIDRFGRRCHPGSYADAALQRLAGPRGGWRVVISFTDPVSLSGPAVKARFRFAALTRIRQVRYSTRTLLGIQAQISHDDISGPSGRPSRFDQAGLRFSSDGIDTLADRVVLGLENPSPPAAVTLLRWYGPAVRLDPRPEHIVLA